jgi:hypothetical protein
VSSLVCIEAKRADHGVQQQCPDSLSATCSFITKLLLKPARTFSTDEGKSLRSDDGNCDDALGGRPSVVDAIASDLLPTTAIATMR